jgi:uncharacterized protein (TIGR03067 family)
MPIIVVGLAIAIGSPLRADAPSSKPLASELQEARRTGWQMARLILDRLEADDQKDFPGIQAWLKDLAKATKGIDHKAAPEKWPAIDIDALTIRNPAFWQAFYEIAPGDPGLTLLQAGLLLSAGEAVRASHLLVVGKQRPGVPKELQQGFDLLLAHCQKAGEKSNQLVAEGIKLHDKEDYAGALVKYKEAVALWPQNGFAHYEMGLTLYHQQLTAAGEKPPAPDAVLVNKGMKHSPAVRDAYAKARRHDPFQVKAYQGEDREVIRGFLALARKGLPAWQKLVKKADGQVEDEVLEQLAGACQEARNHELALLTRQILVARRGGYAPADHPFISTSLRELAPGKQTEEVLKRLAGGPLRLRQLVVPENKEQTGLDPLRGSWEVVKSEPKFEPKRLVFAGDRLTVVFNETKKGEVRIKVDSKARPAYIDIFGDKEKSLGIYEVSGDTLRICFSDSERPARFEARKGVFLITLKREKK